MESITRYWEILSDDEFMSWDAGKPNALILKTHMGQFCEVQEDIQRDDMVPVMPGQRLMGDVVYRTIGGTWFKYISEPVLPAGYDEEVH